jgi:hypothetical protein
MIMNPQPKHFLKNIKNALKNTPNVSEMAAV